MSRPRGRAECERSQHACNPQHRSVLAGLEPADHSACTGLDGQQPLRVDAVQRGVESRNRLTMAQPAHEILTVRILRHFEGRDAERFGGLQQRRGEDLGLRGPLVVHTPHP